MTIDCPSFVAGVAFILLIELIGLTAGVIAISRRFDRHWWF